MDGGAAVAAALVFTWLGMVLGISFLETPLKFRAPGVTLRVGLGIGRLVFRALNAVELALAAGIAVAMGIGRAPAWAGYLIAVGALAVQLAGIRPILNRRSDAVLAGKDAPRSRAHLAYVAVETVKVVALVSTGALLF